MQTQIQKSKQKLTKKEKTLLWTGIPLLIIALAIPFWLIIFPGIIHSGNTPNSYLGIGMMGIALSFFFSIPAFLIGLGLIITSILSHKNIDKPGLVAFEIIISLVLALLLIAMLVIFL